MLLIAQRPYPRVSIETLQIQQVWARFLGISIHGSCLGQTLFSLRPPFLRRGRSAGAAGELTWPPSGAGGGETTRAVGARDLPQFGCPGTELRMVNQVFFVWFFGASSGPSPPEIGGSSRTEGRVVQFLLPSNGRCLKAGHPSCSDGAGPLGFYSH